MDMNTGAGAGMLASAIIGPKNPDMAAATRNRHRVVFEGDLTIAHKDGRIEKLKRFECEIENLTTTEGRTDMLDKYFKGSAYTASWFLGLISNTSLGSIAVGDTAAKVTTSTPNSPTTNDWAESTGYSESVRQTLVFGSASGASLDASASPCVFTINASVVLYGLFVVNNSTKGGTSGKIYGEAAFGSTISLSSGTVTVYPTLTIASA